MEGYKNISVASLVDLIKDYKQGKRTQEKPAVVWFENVREDILKYARAGDPLGLACGLSENDEEIAFYSKAGSPLTDSEWGYDETIGQVRKIQDSEREEFVIPSVIRFDDSGEIKTKIYIHGAMTSYIGEEGLNSVQYGKMIHDNLGIPVFLFYPFKNKEKIKADFSEYDEYLCSDSSRE